MGRWLHVGVEARGARGAQSVDRRSGLTWGVVLAVAIGLLVSAGCAEIGEPDLGEGVGGGPTTTLRTESTDGDQPVQEIVSASVSPVFTPTRPADYEPLTLLSSDSGLGVLDTDLAPVFGSPLLAGSPVVTAVDDYLGGVVVQLQGAIVQWLPANARQGQLVSQGNGSLLGSGFIDDSLAVQVFLGTAAGIDRIQLVDGQREIYTTLGADEQLIDFSSSNGIQVMALSNDTCGELRFLNASGLQLEFDQPNEPECPVLRRPTFGSVAMSPDGGTVAFTRITYRGDGLPASTELVAVELQSSTVLLTQEIGGPGEQIESLDYDGSRFLYLRTGEAGRELVVLIADDLTEVAAPAADNVQHASFARLPLALPALEPAPEPEPGSEQDPATEPPAEEPAG